MDPSVEDELESLHSMTVSYARYLDIRANPNAGKMPWDSAPAPLADPGAICSFCVRGPEKYTDACQRVILPVSGCEGRREVFCQECLFPMQLTKGDVYAPSLSAFPCAVCVGCKFLTPVGLLHACVLGDDETPYHTFGRVELDKSNPVVCTTCLKEAFPRRSLYTLLDIPRPPALYTVTRSLFEPCYGELYMLLLQLSGFPDGLSLKDLYGLYRRRQTYLRDQLNFLVDSAHLVERLGGAHGGYTYRLVDNEPRLLSYQAFYQAPYDDDVAAEGNGTEGDEGEATGDDLKDTDVGSKKSAEVGEKDGTAAEDKGASTEEEKSDKSTSQEEEDSSEAGEKEAATGAADTTVEKDKEAGKEGGAAEEESEGETAGEGETKEAAKGAKKPAKAKAVKTRTAPACKAAAKRKAPSGDGDGGCMRPNKKAKTDDAKAAATKKKESLKPKAAAAKEKATPPKKASPKKASPKKASPKKSPKKSK